jgi:hypothetical protein
MAKHMTNSNTPTQDQIARRAYEIFMERGQPAGEDLAHWLEAEKQLRAAGQPKAAASASASKAQQLTTDAVRATQPAPSNGNSATKSPGTGKTQARASARK